MTLTLSQKFWQGHYKYPSSKGTLIVKYEPEQTWGENFLRTIYIGQSETDEWMNGWMNGSMDGWMDDFYGVPAER